MQLGPGRCLQTLVFYNRICFFFLLFSTPLVSFRIARIWLFVVVPVSRERCRNLQNHIFIFYCILQGGPFWLLHSVETICDFSFLFFHPSQLLFVFFFFRRGGLRYFSLRFRPLSSLFRSFFFIFRPLSSIFRFFFFLGFKSVPASLRPKK